MAAKSNFNCDIRASFATAFRNWRVKNIIPLKQIAADLDLSIATINSWETGKRFPTGPHFELLTHHTGLPPCGLFCIPENRGLSRNEDRLACFGNRRATRFRAGLLRRFSEVRSTCNVGMGATNVQPSPNLEMPQCLNSAKVAM